MTAENVDDGRYALALDEARRAMEQQRADLAGLRDRAGTLLGFTGLASALLGGLAIRDGAKIGGWTWIAAVTFVLIAAAVLFVLWPRTLTLSLDSPTLVTWIEDHDADATKMRRDAALWLDGHYVENRKTLNWMYRAYTAAIVLLMLEISALLLDPKGR